MMEEVIVPTTKGEPNSYIAGTSGTRANTLGRRNYSVHKGFQVVLTARSYGQMFSIYGQCSLRAVQDTNSSAQQDAMIYMPETSSWFSKSFISLESSAIRPKCCKDGNVIVKETNVIAIADSEETDA
ncbi:hypothetical protein Tco_0573665 [Tanacetum coccineum]